MTDDCCFLQAGVCRHEVIGPAIVQPSDCATCIAFNGRESEELTALAEYRRRVNSISNPARYWQCKHLGNRLSVAKCCGQMFACKLHKGKKCVTTGIAVDPFLSCQICPDYDEVNPVAPTIIDSERFTGRCVAVTSCSPKPDRAERQSHCLQSWRDIGLRVIDVQAQGRPTIKTMIDAGAATGEPFMLINADIELYGDHTSIDEALSMPDSLSIGVRYNHAASDNRKLAQREGAGLDCFVMTPAMAATIPDLPFEIGMPVWDYWLPLHFQRLGHNLHWMREPLLFHAQHQVQWSRADWERGAKWLHEHYGVQLEYGASSFRESLGGLHERLK